MKQNYCSYTLGCRNYSLHFLLRCKGQCSKKMQSCIPLTPFLPSTSPPLQPPVFSLGGGKEKANCIKFWMLVREPLAQESN